MEKPANIKTAAAQKGQVRSDIKILLVDDREDNLFSIETILEKDNYTIVKARSGREALKVLLHQQDFSLILMDVQMPELNGFETATIIYERDKLKNIPIIFITGHPDDAARTRAMNAGAVAFLSKPINHDRLVGYLGSALKTTGHQGAHVATSPLRP